LRTAVQNLASNTSRFATSQYEPHHTVFTCLDTVPECDGHTITIRSNYVLRQA